jgi:AbrB family looped-hinge helix DNA binding protein
MRRGSFASRWLTGSPEVRILTLRSKNGAPIVRITSKGQVTIPQDIRERAGLLPHTEVEFKLEGDVVMLMKAVAARRPTRGQLLVDHLARHRGHITMSTDEIMALTRGEE